MGAISIYEDPQKAQDLVDYLINIISSGLINSSLIDILIYKCVIWVSLVVNCIRNRSNI